MYKSLKSHYKSILSFFKNESIYNRLVITFRPHRGKRTLLWKIRSERETEKRKIYKSIFRRVLKLFEREGNSFTRNLLDFSFVSMAAAETEAVNNRWIIDICFGWCRWWTVGVYVSVEDDEGVIFCQRINDVVHTTSSIMKINVPQSIICEGVSRFHSLILCCIARTLEWL